MRDRVIVVRGALLIGILGVWQYVGSASARAGFLVGTPSEVVVQVWTMGRSGEFVTDTCITGAEALAGLAIGTLLGTVAGLGLWFSRSVAAVARPFVFAIGNFPVFAIAPLMIVWFGIGVWMKIAFAAMATLFVAFNLAYRGAQEVSLEYLDVLRAMGASPWAQFRKVVVPASLTGVLATLRVNSGLSLLGAFIGEFVAADRGLGHAIMKAAGLYNVPKAIAAALGIVVVASAFDHGAGFIERHQSSLVQWVSVPKAFRVRV